MKNLYIVKNLKENLKNFKIWIKKSERNIRFFRNLNEVEINFSEHFWNDRLNDEIMGNGHILLNEKFLWDWRFFVEEIVINPGDQIKDDFLVVISAWF